MSLKSRLYGNAGANLYGQVVNVAIQLLQVPILLSFWGTQLYGEWLVLYSVPGYLALTDLGVGAVASNRLSMLVSADQLTEAKIVLRTTWVFLGWVCLVGAFLVTVAAVLFDWTSILSLKTIPKEEASLSLALLCGMVLVSLPTSLIGGLYRAGHHNARGVVIGSTLRLVQLAVIAGTAMKTHSIWITCLGLLILQIVGFIIQLMDVSRFVNSLGLFGSRVDWTDLFSMWRPSLAFMLFPLANGFYFQAATLVVNAYFGPASVVLFNTSRTLTRALTQAISVIKHSLWPEFSHLYGAGEILRLRKLLTLGMESSLLLSLAGSSLLLLLAQPILSWWTHGKVPCDFPLLILLSLATIVNGVWFTASAVLQSTNRHSGYSLVYCLSCAAGLGLSLWLSPHLGLLSVPAFMILVEVITGLYVITTTINILEISIIPFFIEFCSLQEIRNQLFDKKFIRVKISQNSYGSQ
jgi:O-antigen/teichoic acid export membrane protein